MNGLGALITWTVMLALSTLNAGPRGAKPNPGGTSEGPTLLTVTAATIVMYSTCSVSPSLRMGVSPADAWGASTPAMVAMTATTSTNQRRMPRMIAHPPVAGGRSGGLQTPK